MWKTLSIVAAVLLAASAGISFMKKGDLQREIDLLGQAEKNESDTGAHFDDAAEVEKEAQSTLETAKKTNEAEQTKLAAKEEQIKELAAELEGKAEEKETVQAELDDMQERIAVIGQVEDLKTKLAMLQAEQRAATDRVTNLKGSLAAALAEKETTDNVVQGLKTEEIHKNSGIMAGGFTASVAGVNDQWGYVTINAGNNRGVVTNAKLDVVRNGEVVGQVKVTNVEQTRSVADILPETLVEGTSVQPGDQLRVNTDSTPAAAAVGGASS